MKRFQQVLIILVICLLLAGCNLPNQQENHFISVDNPPEPATVLDPGQEGDKINPQEEALRKLIGDSEIPVEVSFNDGFPRSVLGRIPVEGTDPADRAKNYLQTYADLFLLTNPDVEIKIKRVGGYSGEDVFFYQLYKGVQVYGGELVVSLDDEVVYSSIGNLLPDLNIEVVPEITALQAEVIGNEYLDSPSGLDQAGRTTLYIYDESFFTGEPAGLRLIWEVHYEEPATRKLLIDAISGAVIQEISLNEHLTQYTLLDDRARDADPYLLGLCTFYENWPIDFTVGNQSGYINYSYILDEDSVAASQYMAATLSFFANNFNVPVLMVSPFPSLQKPFYLLVHHDNDNAMLHDHGLCTAMQLGEGWISYEIIVHEYTHYLINQTSDLGPMGWSGALDEHYCDIMAALADGNWTVGEDRTGYSEPYRDISNPPAFGDPDHISVISGGEKHSLAGIPNKAAYLISEGGTHYGITIKGIGREKMGELYYATMVTLPWSAGLDIARNATLARAKQWAKYGTAGFTDFDVCQVQNAWASVGVGNPDQDCDGTDDLPKLSIQNLDLDWIDKPSDNCPAAFNPRQKDLDSDGLGDACDEDIDNDGVSNEEDNCSIIEGLGIAALNNASALDGCEDADDDNIPDPIDNCVGEWNPDQLDRNNDQVGDACDPDSDDDGTLRGEDNCPLVRNSRQYDQDKDGIGDECDNCPGLKDSDQTDTDKDGLGDPCDDDDDGDGYHDIGDNCPVHYNPDQSDWDNDGIGTACDPDEQDHLNKMEFSFDSLVKKPAGDIVLIPLPSCLPECLDFAISDLMIEIKLIGVPDDVDIRLVNQQGESVIRPIMMDDDLILYFMPRGGDTYFFRIFFGQGYSKGDEIRFVITEKHGPAKEILPLSLQEQDQPPQSVDVCEIFEGEKMSIVLLDVTIGDVLDQWLYIEWPDPDPDAPNGLQGWPGVEIPMQDDPDPWAYSATLGNFEADKCIFQGYEGKLHCHFGGLPVTLLDTSQRFELRVNKCSGPIYSHDWVSILGQETSEGPHPTETAAPACSSSLGPIECAAAGGTFSCAVFPCSCSCPGP